MRSARLGSIDSVGSDVGMSRSTSRREEMEAWLAFRETEGLTYRELAEESGINVNTLAYWASRLRREADLSRAGEVSGGEGFVELVVAEDDGGDSAGRASPTPSIEIVSGDLVIRVPAGFDAPTLHEILAVVATRC